MLINGLEIDLGQTADCLVEACLFHNYPKKARWITAIDLCPVC
jgi:hypothetical protein